MAEEIVWEEFKWNYATYVFQKDKRASCQSKTRKVCPVFLLLLNTTYSIPFSAKLTVMTARLKGVGIQMPAPRRKD